MCPQTAPPAPPLALGGPAAAPAPPRPWGRVAPPAATPPGGPRALVDAIVAGGGKLLGWLPLLERAKRAMPPRSPIRSAHLSFSTVAASLRPINHATNRSGEPIRTSNTCALDASLLHDPCLHIPMHLLTFGPHLNLGRPSPCDHQVAARRPERPGLYRRQVLRPRVCSARRQGHVHRHHHLVEGEGHDLDGQVGGLLPQHAVPSRGARQGAGRLRSRAQAAPLRQRRPRPRLLYQRRVRRRARPARRGE